MAKVVTLGKCLTMCFSGGGKEAVEHWVAKMGLQGKRSSGLTQVALRAVAQREPRGRQCDKVQPHHGQWNLGSSWRIRHRARQKKESAS